MFEAGKTTLRRAERRFSHLVLYAIGVKNTFGQKYACTVARVQSQRRNRAIPPEQPKVNALQLQFADTDRIGIFGVLRLHARPPASTR